MADDRSTSQKPYTPGKKESVNFTTYDRIKPFHRVVFNVQSMILQASWKLTYQYRTRPVLELMGIVEAPEPIVAPVVPAGPWTKRKRTSTARVKELEVSLLLD
jgi:hypothetical protein